MSISSHFKEREVFFSYNTYANRDKKLFQELKSSMVPVEKEYADLLWYDSNRIGAGKNINQFLQAHLNAAVIIVLLISPDYLASDRCREQEMQPALALAKAGAARLIPVLLRPIDQAISPLAPYKLLPSNGVPISDWPHRDNAYLEVAKEVRLVLEEFTQSSTLYPSPTPHQMVASKISYASNRLFTDRKAILDKISSSFASAQHGSTPVLALSGLPGMGKTQIAQEYGSDLSRRYQDVFWLNASSRALLSKDVGTYVAQLSLSVEDDKNEKQLFDAFRRGLQTRENWLLVLDFLEDIDLARSIVPQESGGHALLTTRMQSTDGYAFSVFTVSSMDTDSGALFLLRRATILSMQDSLDDAPPNIAEKARAISDALDGFPLALDHAGAYIEETGCDLAAYLKLYKEKGLQLLGPSRQATDNSHKSVTSTLELILDQFAQKPDANLDLLSLLAFLHPDFISEELLEEGSSVLPRPLRMLVTDTQALHRTFAALLNFSLIYRNPDDRSILQMHRLVQQVLINKLPARQQHRWAILAVRLVNHVFPVVSFNTWKECQRYLPHALHCADLISRYELTIKEGALLLERLGFYRFQQAAYDDAEKYLKQALQLYRDHLETETLNKVQTMNSLGLLYSELAQYQKAKELHEHARELREQELGAEHPKTAESLHNLAIVYEDQGRYKKAEELYQQALDLEERSKGSDHPDVAKTLNNLASIYLYQKRYSEAETTYSRALTIYERFLSPDNPDLIHPLDGLGFVAEQQGNLRRAEQFYQRALAISQKAWKEDHPETAHSFTKLAGIAELRGDNERAEKFYKDALAIGERVFTPEHLDIVLFLNNLAFLANKQGQYQKAEPLYDRILNIYAQTQETHPDMALVLNNLARFYRNVHKEKEAEEVLRHALAIQKDFLDPTDLDITLNLNTLTDVLIEQHRDEEAMLLLQRAFAILLLGTASHEHPNIESVREKYALLLERLHRDEEAKEIRQRTLKQVRESFTELSSDDH